VARYGFGAWVQQWAGAGFPWGTFVVNVLGCLGLGVVLGLLGATPRGGALAAFLTIGVLGAFTTFSTFSWETVALVQNGQYLKAALYLSGSVAVGFLALVAGLGLTGALFLAEA
jgi:CrcB protein